MCVQHIPSPFDAAKTKVFTVGSVVGYDNVKF